MSEVVKRLEPLDKTKRILWLESGGYCCKCMAPLITPQRDYIGKIAHIEAASQGGPRFNVEQSNDDRRQEHNLMLVCPTCHEEIDIATSTFTVEILKNIKKVHAERIRDLEKEFVVLIDNEEIIYPQNLILLYDFVELDEDSIEKGRAEDIKELSEGLKVLSKIPRHVRKYFCFLAENSNKDMEISSAYAQESSTLSYEDEKNYFRILEEKKIAYYDHDEENISLRLPGKNNELWLLDLSCFCLKNNIKLEKLLVDLNFSYLDK
ncbi:hypothetical protein ACQUEF_03595 [Vagococcus fluvialis]|uniref:hypothetical protein n=1 Tax=Vagococcus fluvialis TaxID=2738 RepID=UPI003D137F52